MRRVRPRLPGEGAATERQQGVDARRRQDAAGGRDQRDAARLRARSHADGRAQPHEHRAPAARVHARQADVPALRVHVPRRPARLPALVQSAALHRATPQQRATHQQRPAETGRLRAAADRSADRRGARVPVGQGLRAPRHRDAQLPGRRRPDGEDLRLWTDTQRPHGRLLPRH